MKVAFVVYPDFTALDLVGPYEVISRWPGAEVHFVSSATDPVRCDSGLTVLPTDTRVDRLRLHGSGSVRGRRPPGGQVDDHALDVP